jgi:hypothetical protein
MKKLIIGLGTGRCGSLSLSSFLSDQQGIQVLHEGNINEPDKAKVLGLYWDMYYEEIDRLILEYPEHICCLSTESLNSLIGRNEILDFIGYKGERKVNGNYIKNKHDDFNSFYKNSLNILLWMGRHTLPKSVRHLLWKIIGKNLYNYINW